jgi:DNA-binding NtrC family response regulator
LKAAGFEMGQEKGPPRVLILDDEEGPRKAWSFILKHWYEEIEVVVADNGDGAWQALSKSNFDLFVTDIRHPGKSCQEVFECLSKAKATCQIIVASAGVSQNPEGQWVWGQAWVQSWGPNLKITCLSKPVSVDDFRAAVETALQIPARR